MPGLIDNKTGEFTFNVEPSAIEVTFDEKCNLACDYCFMNKSCSKQLSAEQAIMGVDWLFKLGDNKKSITFNSGETIIHFPEFKKFCEHVYSVHNDELSHHGNVLTTNGLEFTAEHYKFVKEIGIGLNISLDGAEEQHDSHRIKANDGKGSFAIIKSNLDRIGKEIGDVHWLSSQKIMVIMTIAKENFCTLKSDAMKMIEMGFVKLDIFPNMLDAYNDEEIKVLRQQLESLKEEIRKINLQNPSPNINVYWMNRVWSKHCLSKVLLCADGLFYLLDGINMLPYRQRKSFVVGSFDTGIDVEKREKIYRALINSAKTYARRQYQECESERVITFPIQLYLWCISRKKDFKVHFDSFLKVSKLFLEMGSTLNSH